MSCLQVTNRDLSVAVLRKFLPQLAQELADGTLKRKMKTAAPKHEANGGPAPAKVGLVHSGAHSYALLFIHHILGLLMLPACSTTPQHAPL